jgi:hypothetical protein
LIAMTAHHALYVGVAHIYICWLKSKL